jgi:hypothetical protein
MSSKIYLLLIVSFLSTLLAQSTLDTDCKCQNIPNNCNALLDALKQCNITSLDNSFQNYVANTSEDCILEGQNECAKRRRQSTNCDLISCTQCGYDYSNCVDGCQSSCGDTFCGPNYLTLCSNLCNNNPIGRAWENGPNLGMCDAQDVVYNGESAPFRVYNSSSNSSYEVTCDCCAVTQFNNRAGWIGGCPLGYELMKKKKSTEKAYELSSPANGNSSLANGNLEKPDLCKYNLPNSDSGCDFTWESWQSECLQLYYDSYLEENKDEECGGTSFQNVSSTYGTFVAMCNSFACKS